MSLPPNSFYHISLSDKQIKKKTTNKTLTMLGITQKTNEDNSKVRGKSK